MRFEFDNTVCLAKPENAAEIAALEVVRTGAKVMAPGAKYMHNHKLYLRSKGKAGWDGKTSIISKVHPMNGAQFPTGMLPLIHDKLVAALPDTIMAFDDLRVMAPPVAGVHGLHTMQLRDYQQQALDAALGNMFLDFPWPRGVLKIATGGGKTELAVAMYQTVQMPTVFIVHRKHLVKQAIDRFKHYGIEAGQIGDGVFDPMPQGITVATIQTLHNILKKGDMSKINQFIKAQQIFFDEAHLCAAKLDKGNQFILLSRQFRHAMLRWGLTATPFMKDEYSNQLLMGCTGDIIFEISNDTLIKAGHLTKPKVTIIKMDPVSGPPAWPECYDSAIVLNEDRNKRIISELKKVPTPAIIMVNRVAHAMNLSNMAKQQGLFLPVVQGSTSTEVRTQTISNLQSGKTKHIIATTVFDEGMDLPELRSIILAGGGKSKVAMLQRIGRGLRIAKGKQSFALIDFKDMSGYVMKKHSKMRRDTWLEEGFDIEEIT
jgi:superfamily II DNA or RNA helicase